MSGPSVVNTSPAELTEFWQQQVKQQQASGLSYAKYCHLHNLSYCRFLYWNKKLRQAAAPVELMPVVVQAAASKPGVLATVLFKNGKQLQIHDQSILPVLLASLD